MTFLRPRPFAVRRYSTRREAFVCFALHKAELCEATKRFGDCARAHTEGFVEIAETARAVHEVAQEQ